MIRIIATILGAGLLYAVYWAAAGWWLQNSIADWFDTQRGRGWQADYAELSLTGFPSRQVTAIAAPALADPTTGAAWQADALTIDSRAVWPGHVTVSLPDAPQRFAYFDQTLEVTTKGLSADLRLKPGLALELESVALTSGAWSAVQDDEPLARADSLTLSAKQADTTETYAITARADAFAPGARLRRVARLTRTLPDAFETFEFQAIVTFDKPWDRSAVEVARPQPRHVNLRLAEAQWGALRVLAAGEFTVDAAGVPEGTITIKAENWRDMLLIAQQSGVLPDELARAAERSLTLLEGLGGNPNALDLRLNLRGGAVALGPIPLGAAPRLTLR